MSGVTAALKAPSTAKTPAQTGNSERRSSRKAVHRSELTDGRHRQLAEHLEEFPVHRLRGLSNRRGTARKLTDGETSEATLHRIACRRTFRL
jgi:hypothetical protein